MVNSVFLYYCTKAGLDLAIVNAERIERFPSIPEHERKLAEDLLFNRVARGCAGRSPASRASPRRARRLARAEPRTKGRHQPVSHRGDFRTLPRGGGRKKARPEDLPLDQRLANYILEGSKDGLIDDWIASAPKASRRSTSSTAR